MVFGCILFWIFKTSASSRVLHHLQNYGLLTFERANLHHGTVINTSLESGLKPTMLSFIPIITGTIHHPANFVMTGLDMMCIRAGRLTQRVIQNISIYNFTKAHGESEDRGRLQEDMRRQETTLEKSLLSASSVAGVFNSPSLKRQLQQTRREGKQLHADKARQIKASCHKCG